MLGARGGGTMRMRPSTKPDAPMRAKYMSRAKSVPAGAQRPHRRREARLEIDEAADSRRASLANSKPHTFELLVEANACDVLDSKGNAVRPFALLARLDKAGNIHIPGRRRQ